MADIRLFRDYVIELNRSLSDGNATEHTHRPALKTLLESVQDGITATNEPTRIECGAPDYSISSNGLTIGYIEAKDIGVSLDAIERDANRKNPNSSNGKQLRRYRDALPNLIFTNYTEFRWYVNGERRLSATLADANGRSGLTASREGISETDELLSAFLAESAEPVSSPEELARRMARLTHMIRDVVREAFANKQASNNVGDLYKATRQTLVDDLSLDDFADMFAQTLAYGLFAARVNTDANTFHWSTAAGAIPSANPFLRRVFDLTAGIDAKTEPFIGFVDDLSQLLANSDMEAVLSDFGRRGARQDPIMHFYETFLAAYDPQLRERRGVYYTPEPVISYIVRSVDYLLRERFGCPDGLADYQTAEYETLEDVDGEQKPVTKQSHRVLLLDPACGTGSFLYSVIDHIREQFRSGGNAGMWDGYVREHLLPRIFGFELMMAPYAMAHLKLGMQLAAQDMPVEHRANWAYDFGNNERLGVYLTNSLENAEQQAVGLWGPMRVITEEANAAAEIKRELPIMVVLGNPPYSGHSSNASRRNDKLTWIGELIEDYKRVDGKPLGERNPKWLQDDYVKFIRFGQWRIQQSGAGILAFITNHSYLDNPTFRGMRQQLMDTFSDIYLIDLHGNALKKETAPDGSSDQNVFDIRQGVAIAVFVKGPTESGQARVHHADLYGERQTKYETLSEADISGTDWERLQPKSPNYLFKPWNYDLAEEYEHWHKITDVMPVNSAGIVTGQDKVAIRWEYSEMIEAARDFTLPGDEEMNETLVKPILYRPFDTRYTYYSDAVITRRRQDVMRHMLSGNNLGLIFMRQVALDGAYDHFGMSTEMIDNRAFYSSKGIVYFAPLYTYLPEQGLEGSGAREPNLSPEFTADMAQRLGLRFIPDGEGDLDETFGPEDVFHYIYAVFHSPTYRERYDQFLRADFPRVPLTDDIELFRVLVGLGGELTAVHLLKSDSLSAARFGYPVPGDNVVEKAHPKYYAPGEKPPGETAPIERGRVYISKSNRRSGKQGQYFDGVSPEVWESRIGGYRPMDKWLKDRKGRTLTFDDIAHYQRIAAALQETMRLTSEIDAAVADAGMFAVSSLAPLAPTTSP
ncbi:MAG: N-6 DNA methylase [Chloroflexi bacterium]|nr:N-6 DNA methylase [Chloroflexota bacterium]